MTDGSRLFIRTLNPEDLTFAFDLGGLARWNQTQRDWERLLAYEPDGCFLATCEGQPAGTVTTTSYGTRLGWIGMMLVHPDFRRRGIAKELMKQSIDFLRDRSVACIKLDATPDGFPLYKQLGFQMEWEFHRWERTGAGSPGPLTPAPQPILHDRLDLAMFGADRRSWLEQVAADSIVLNCDDGFGMLRPGRLANYLGPVVARDEKTARRLIEELLALTPHRIFWDIPPNTAAQQIAGSLGFARLRPLTRMWLDKPLDDLNLDLQYAMVDPATG